MLRLRWAGLATLGVIDYGRRYFTCIGTSIGASTCLASIGVSWNVPLRVLRQCHWLPCHPARLQLGVHALALPLLIISSRSKRPYDSNGGRILLRHCDGIVPSLFSSNRLDNATYQCASSFQHWNVHSCSSGLEAFLLRSRLLSAGFSSNQPQQSYRFQGLQYLSTLLAYVQKQEDSINTHHLSPCPKNRGSLPDKQPIRNA